MTNPIASPWPTRLAAAAMLVAKVAVAALADEHGHGVAVLDRPRAALDELGRARAAFAVPAQIDPERLLLIADAVSVLIVAQLVQCT